MNDQLSASYRIMVQNAAWKDLADLLETLEKESNKELDLMPVEHLSATVAAHGRGVRETVAKIRSHVDYAISGGPK